MGSFPASTMPAASSPASPGTNAAQSMLQLNPNSGETGTDVSSPALTEAQDENATIIDSMLQSTAPATPVDPWAGFETWTVHRFFSMPGFGKTEKDCKWTAKQMKAEITARKGTPPVNNRRKPCWDALYKLRVVQSAAAEDREAIEDGETDAIAFGADDFCGLAHVMSSAKLALALARDVAGKNRQEIDDKSVGKSCFDKEAP